ncbi:MAG: hypothetical protein IKV09_03130 [Alistipes sp.]|nr:hypothetical protein [Alistipes sp.]
MELYNGKYCASYDDLACVMSRDQIMRHAERVCRGGNGRAALYAVDTLPVRFKIEVMRRYPDLQAQAEYKEFADAIITDTAAEAYYAEYKIDGVRGLSYEKQEEYTNNATILAAFHDLLQRCTSMRGKLGKRVNLGGFWEARAKMLPRIADRFPNTLPENARRLREKHDEFYRGGTPNYEVLISRKFQNSNAAKVLTDEQLAIFKVLCANGNNLDNVEVARAYNEIATTCGWNTITSSAVKVLRQKYQLETAAGRLGKGEFYNNIAPQVSRRAPEYPLYMWSLDGWKAELAYQKTTERNGKSVTTYHNRLTLEVVLDPCTKYPIGYAIGEEECGELIKMALRNAIDHTAELFGQRYRAHQVQSDNFAISMMRGSYEAVAVNVTPARVGNAKSKPIERYFGSLNKRYAKWCANWTGYGITSDKTKQPNADIIALRKKDYPTFEELCKQLTAIIYIERELHREEYIARWQRMPEDKKLPMPDEQYLLAFGEETGYKNALEGSGLNIRLLGARRQYDCFDVNFRRHAHIRWNVKYDPKDTSRVLAVNDDGTLRFMLEEKYVQPMALVEQTEEDKRQLYRTLGAAKHLECVVKSDITNASLIAQGVMEQYPQLQDSLLSRLMITDSSGQHKRQLQADRRRLIDLPSEVITVDEPQAAGVEITAAPKKTKLSKLKRY